MNRRHDDGRHDEALAQAGLTRVLVADDHAIMRAGVCALVAGLPGMRVVAEAVDALQAISAARRLLPELAIVDIRMPHTRGVEVFVELRRWSPTTRLVALTGVGAPALFTQLIDLGIHGLFVKHGDPDILARALPRIAAGDTVIDPQARGLLQQGSALARPTPRELQVLRGIARGETNAGMAARMGVSAKTIDSHRSSLMGKLQAGSAADLVRRAIGAGLIEAADSAPEP